ncbi:MAG: hypothetical protein AAF490_16205 [Chloroflexota bacterium]
MTELKRKKIDWFVNVGLLTAVIVFTLTPLLGINLAVYSPTHNHIYFGEVDVEHDHHGHDHAHEVNVKKMSQIELFQFFNESIAFLTDKDVGNLGLFYIALIMLNSGLLLYSANFNSLNWSPKQFGIQLVYHSPLLPPPR